MTLDSTTSPAVTRLLYITLVLDRFIDNGWRQLLLGLKCHCQLVTQAMTDPGVDLTYTIYKKNSVAL